MEHIKCIPEEGFVYRNKINPDDFSFTLFLGDGRVKDEYDEVPVSVYEEYLAEQKRKMREEMGIGYEL